MSDSKLPTEVELVYEVMPCNALRTAQEPVGPPHPCTYFRKWGTYHSFDYIAEGPPPSSSIASGVKYVGRAPLLPEMLSGCRKAPILAVGINPNLPGWSPQKRGALNPLFDDYKQYAHYFRYRSISKLILSTEDYARYGGGPQDTPFSTVSLNVPPDDNGARVVQARLDPQTMYRGYEGLLHELADRVGWPKQGLRVGEDLAYANMVACPSARWRTQPDPKDPKLPPMTLAERDGIVTECFRKRRYFLRQLAQALPQVILVFSQNTANAFLSELWGNFSQGDPKPKEPVEELIDRHIRLRYGQLPDGSLLDARVIFSPHISGDPENFKKARQKVLDQLVEEAESGRLQFNAQTKHLARSRGACAFCPTLEIGDCDYTAELKPLSLQPEMLAPGAAAEALLDEKRVQRSLLNQPASPALPIDQAWGDDTEATT
jgi:hypothetical protein